MIDYFRAFMSGMARSLDLFGVMSAAPKIMDDKSAIESDWKAVMGDYTACGLKEGAIREFQEETGLTIEGFVELVFVRKSRSTICFTYIIEGAKGNTCPDDPSSD